MPWLGFPLALLAGAALGAFGAGGSILVVPILVYALGVPPRSAIATSLFVVAVTSATGLLLRLRSREVRFRLGLLFGLAGMAGAYAGGSVAWYLPEPLLLAGFASLMIMAAVAMLRMRARDRRTRVRPVTGRRVAMAALLGLAVGFVAGLVGAGGGFLIVPALVLFGRLGIRSAIATSLLVVGMQSLAGLFGHVSHLDLNWPLTGVVTALAVVGSAAGTQLARRMKGARLRRGFAWFVLVSGITMLFVQIPFDWLRAVQPWLAALLAQPDLDVAGSTGRSCGREFLASPFVSSHTPTA